jgi:uncharacterized membrane protein
LLITSIIKIIIDNQRIILNISVTELLVLTISKKGKSKSNWFQLFQKPQEPEVSTKEMVKNQRL